MLPVTEIDKIKLKRQEQADKWRRTIEEVERADEKRQTIDWVETQML